MELAQPTTHRAGHRRATHPGNPVLQTSKRVSFGPLESTLGPSTARSLQFGARLGNGALRAESSFPDHLVCPQSCFLHRLNTFDGGV